MWMFEQVMHAPCGEGFWWGGGSGGGWANSVRVDVAFMWMLRSCRFLNRSCMLRVAKGSGGGGGSGGGVG